MATCEAHRLHTVAGFLAVILLLIERCFCIDGNLGYIIDNGAEFADSAGRWDDSDLHAFVSRPDIRSPKIKISINKEDKATPGYFFVAPYDCLECRTPVTSYVGQQIGPHIYDHQGELIWSGAGLFRDRPAFDFKIATIHGSDHLTLIAANTTTGRVFEDGVGFVLDASFQQTGVITNQGAKQDMHEFTIIDNGASAIISVLRERHNEAGRWLRDYGFQEIDVKRESVNFEWWASEHLTLEKRSQIASSPDPFHLNSIEKTVAGDYLVSLRHTDTIYLISGVDGRVIWRLGGKYTDFVFDGFNFSRQHDARIQSYNNTMTEISLLDNAWDGEDTKATATASSLLRVALHVSASPMRATLIRRYERPDGEHSFARGNMQVLNGGNAFGHWGDEAYMTEHTEDGELVFEARFARDRFVNYRAYKFNFTSSPTDWPAVKAFASTNAGGDFTTAVYASWDGATEVHSWRIYSATHEDDHGTVIDNVRKTGFETSVVCQGHHPWISVAAIDVHGEILSQSAVVNTELPLGWHDATFDTVQHVRFDNDLQLRRLAISFTSGMIVMFFLLRRRPRRLAKLLGHC